VFAAAGFLCGASCKAERNESCLVSGCREGLSCVHVGESVRPGFPDFGKECLFLCRDHPDCPPGFRCDLSAPDIPRHCEPHDAGVVQCLDPDGGVYICIEADGGFVRWRSNVLAPAAEDAGLSDVGGPPPAFECHGDHIDSDLEFVFSRKLEGRNPVLPPGLDAGRQPHVSAVCVVRRDGRLDACTVTWAPTGTEAEILDALRTWRVSLPWLCPHLEPDGGHAGFVPMVDKPQVFFPGFEAPR
jgi:hypothetical protein